MEYSREHSVIYTITLIIMKAIVIEFLMDSL